MDDPLVREAAVAALGALGDEQGLPAVLAATTDKPADVRRNCRRFMLTSIEIRLTVK